MSFRAARQAAGKSVQEVVQHMGVTDGAIYQWENGISKPTVDKLIKLAAFYGTTTDDLLREDNADAVH